MNFKSITISGPVAAGTTTAAKTLASKLNLKYHSAGDFFRNYMIKHNIPLHAHSQIPDDVDRRIDQELTALAEKGGTIIDARYIGYFTRNSPQVLKILLTADQEERIKRALQRTHTHQETRENIILRETENEAKFRKLYADENFLDPKFFDLVIDTTNTRPEEVVKQISNRFNGK